MRGLNKVLIVGHVARVPELRTSKTGMPWCALSVGTNRPRKQDGEWVEATAWHRVKVFGAQAESCARNLRPGSTVAIDGSLAYDQWIDSDGVNRHTTDIVADRVTFMQHFGVRKQATETLPAVPATA